MIAEGSALMGALAAVLPQAEMQELFSSDDWSTLKTIWRTLDGIKPSDGFYDFPIAVQKGDSITARLRGLFTGMEFEDPDVSRSLDMILDLTVQRTMRLSRMSPLLMTRMIPPWTETVQDGMLFSFENRISTLSELVRDGSITASEYAAARDSLLDRAVTLSLLEIVNDLHSMGLYDYPGLDEGSVNADTILRRLDMSYTAALDTLQKAVPSQNKEYYMQIVEQHERFLEDYREFSSALPVFRTMLSELMEAAP